MATISGALHPLARRALGPKGFRDWCLWRYRNELNWTSNNVRSHKEEKQILHYRDMAEIRRLRAARNSRTTPL